MNLEPEEDDDEEVEGTLNVNTVKLQKAMATKYHFLWFQLIFIHALIFYYLPFKGNYHLHGSIDCNPPKVPTEGNPDDIYVARVEADGYHCNSFINNTALIIFYLLNVWHLYLQALQIRFGYPEIRKANFLMKNDYDGLILKYSDLLLLWEMIPFVWELKVFIDWTFSKTSLDVYAWFKFTNIHYELYMLRCGGNGYATRKPGEPVDLCEKSLCGGFFLTLIFGLLVMPLYLFSDLGTSLNPVISANMAFTLKIADENGLSSELQMF